MPKNVKQLILNKLKHKPSIKAAQIIEATGFSREYVNRFFKELVASGKLKLVGKANQAHYVLSNKRINMRVIKFPQVTRRQLINDNLNEDTVLNEIKQSSVVFFSLPNNICGIVDYAFTEMLNNAIDHSRSKKITVIITRNKGALRFDVIDSGVGIFNNIRQKRHLTTTLAAIQDLLKGKQTTAPKKHSGQGIFFTSKVADILTIRGSNKKLIFNNIIDDIFIRDAKPTKGTKITFFINLESKKILREMFKQYSGTAYGFDKTKVGVKLFELDDQYVSRSQARRIIAGLEKFKHITLDFKGVKTIGQGFADEVFRVWQKNHPGIVIEIKNMNENVKFMIKRAQNE